MKALILLFFFAVTGFTLVRLYLRNLRVKNATGGLLKALERNELGFDEVAAELGMRIRERPAPALNGGLESLNWEQFKGRKLDEGRFEVLAVLKKTGSGVIFISNGMVSDTVPSYNGGREVSKTYPCLLHIRHILPGNTLLCASSMPADKDHQHLLEDLADNMLATAGVTSTFVV